MEKDEEKLVKKVKKEKVKRSARVNNIIFDIIMLASIIMISCAISPKTLQNDTFYNIKCGEYLWKHGVFNVIGKADPFTWHNVPYTWPHWLFDLCTYFINVIAGGNYGKGLYVATIVGTMILGLCLYILSIKLTKNNRVVSRSSNSIYALFNEIIYSSKSSTCNFYSFCFRNLFYRNVVRYK